MTTSSSSPSSSSPSLSSFSFPLLVSPPTVSFTPLLVLLTAKSTDLVESIIIQTFRLQAEGLSKEKRQEWSSSLSITEEQTNELYISVCSLLRLCLYHSAATRDDITALFPANFHSSLKSLLSKLIAQNMNNFREQTSNNTTAPPKLVDFDWRVDLKTSSGHLSRMRVPTIFLSLSLSSQPDQVGQVPDVNNYQLELSKQALGTMLSGLEKIREQLAGMQQ